MKKNKISYGLNLDNLRCLLYGAGTNDLLSDTPLFETPVWPRSTGQFAIDNRKAFLDVFFPFCVKNLLDRYVFPLDSKAKTEFLSEISTRRTARRGTVNFLEEVQELYTTDGKALSDTINQVRLLLASTQSKDIGTKLLHYIDTVLPAEKERIPEKMSSDYVCHILLLLRDQLANTIVLHDSIDSIAKPLSLLIIAALLKEKFPMGLMDSVWPVEIKSVYWAKALVSAVLINLSVLCLQLQEQDSFLEECHRMMVSQNYSMHSINQLYKLKLQQLDAALKTADITTLDMLMTWENKSQIRSHALFLHRIYRYVDVFIREGLEKVNRYIAIVTPSGISSVEEIRDLIRHYQECLPFLRLIVYWHIVGFYSLLPSETTGELYQFAAKVAPFQADSFLTLVKMEPEAVMKQCTLHEEKLRHSLTTVQNGSLKIIFPEPFYQVGFSQYISHTELRETKAVRFLTGQSCVPYEECIIDEFFIQFEQMDKVCYAGSQVLSLLRAQAVPGQEKKARQIEDRLQEFLLFLQTASQSPTVLIQKPLSDLLCKKGIDLIEFQNFFTQIATTASSFLHSVERIQNSPSTESMRISLDFFAASVHFQIKFLRRTPNYWFAGWDSESMAHIQQKLDSLLCLHSSVSEWKLTQKEAEGWIHNALDEEENSLGVQERKVANGAWEILNLKAKLNTMGEGDADKILY